MSQDTIAFVGCGERKRDGKTKAYAKYKSSYFEGKFVAAVHLGIPVIASAKHGYLPIGESIEDYDESLSNKTDTEIRAWGEDVVSDIPSHANRVFVLAGKDYRNGIKHGLSEHRPDIEYVELFEHTSGNGDQHGRCNDIVSAIKAGESVDGAVDGVLE